MFIGKTFGRYYLLRRLLGAEIEVLWMGKASIYLYTKEGVFRVPPTDITPTETLIAICDSDNTSTASLECVYGQASRTFPVFHSSPAPARWQRFHKQRDMLPIILVMNPWKRQEAYQA